MEKAGNTANLNTADPDVCSLPDSHCELAPPMAPVPTKDAGKKKQKRKQKPKQLQQSGNNQRGVLFCGSDHGFAENSVAVVGINPHVDHADELYQDTLSPHQHEGNMEINLGRVGMPPASYADMLK
ncbi:hypothetical protein Nepgr_033507 [Nepenthes gracilis]|uniref:Uncharacterized protein n=1 Tax=Nepenthes gracilis TaxID=150966 RepID=A0AAD3Y6Z5_NEPGR|nr:hypothetical protein Nepgr_033507 [Nepenthes gracilis]